MAKNKIFVIQTIDYSYNDEYYYESGENGGVGNAIQAFRSLEKAQDEYLTLSLNELSLISIDDYVLDYETINDYKCDILMFLGEEYFKLLNIKNESWTRENILFIIEKIDKSNIFNMKNIVKFVLTMSKDNQLKFVNEIMPVRFFTIIDLEISD